MKPWAKKQIDEALKRGNKTQNANDHPPRSAADVELPVRNPLQETYPGPAFDSRVNISIVSYRVRLADPDGVSRKAAIDGLVYCGILKNDSAKEIASVRHRQVKVKTISEEKTVIKIQEA